MRITKPKRGRGPVKRIDLTDMRELFRDRRMWSAVGIVTAPEGEPYWEVVTNEDGSSVDVVVEVVLQPSEQHVTCRLRSGMWEVPAEGDEVAVLIPEGQIDFMPIVIARLSGNAVPTTQGPSPTRIAIVAPSGGEVVVHDGSGGADPLVRRSEFLDHAHPTAAAGAPSAPQRITGDPDAVPPIAPLAVGAVGFPGTDVLKAK
ncbi:MAG TPA: hypothetical protein VMZ53_03870 [Kofleriaceae bacterium]|nr:hypothetical protein [Kofleriaceae bacterium]